MQNSIGFMELLTTKRAEDGNQDSFCVNNIVGTTLVQARTLDSTIIARFTGAKTIYYLEGRV
jgi:hypothetical protein